MTTPTAPGDTTPASSGRAVDACSAQLAVAAGALTLAGAAQLITISALVTSGYPLAATWWSLLLGIAPAPLAAAAAFAPAPAGRLAGVAGVLVLVAAISGGIVHIGVFFVPALVVLAVGTVKLWGEER
jgi:hypothetical protein